MSLIVSILAAGKGTRMRSKFPKVLQPLAKKPLLAHVINTAKSLQPNSILTVIGHEAETVQKVFVNEPIEWVAQTEQLGTGHAVKQVLPHVNDEDVVLILYGDVPLTQTSTLEDLLSLIDDEHPLSLLTVTLDTPTGYGRIIRNAHTEVVEIVEEKDAMPEQKLVTEVNTGIMAVKGIFLKEWLSQLNNHNAQQEYYLTDIIKMCVTSGYKVATTHPQNELEVRGVNDKLQLQQLERDYQYELAKQLLQQGVTLLDAHRLDIRGDLSVSTDVEIDANVIFEGKVTIAEGAKIGPNCFIKDSVIGKGVHIQANCYIEGANIGQGAVIGPFARLRPGSELAEMVKIGNFVETKKVRIGKGSKVNHLSYIGDTAMGEACNIGAGTITCNYDGVNKHQTIIGDRVFVGSDTQLVAPVEIGDDATIGAGSTITKDAPADKLSLSRSKQVTIPNWQKPVKK